jgi:hypothetical protein
MARGFVTPGLKVNALVLVPGLRRVVPIVAERLLPGAYYFETARVKHIDQVLCTELEHGITQPDVLAEAYLKNKRGRIAGRPYGFAAIVQAQVIPRRAGRGEPLARADCGGCATLT